MGKGEIAHEQILLFPQCFQEVCFQGASKGIIVWEWVKGIVALVKFFFLGVAAAVRHKGLGRTLFHYESWY